MSTNIPAREAPFPISFEGKASAQKHNEDPLLDTDQIQGNILAGLLKDNQTLIFLDIKNVENFRPWLKALAPFIATTDEVLEFNRLFKTIRIVRRKPVRGHAQNANGNVIPLDFNEVVLNSIAIEPNCSDQLVIPALVVLVQEATCSPVRIS